MSTYPATSATAPAARSSAWVTAVSLGVLGSVLLFVLLLSVYSPMKDDIAWLLYVASKWLSGRTLYVDLVEVNPPLIIWLSAIPAIIARVLDVSPKFVAMPLFIVQSLASAWWTSGLFARQQGPLAYRLPVFSLIATLLLLLPGSELGQREHMLVAGFLPYLVLSAQTLEGRVVAPSSTVAAGIFAALFCALKPLYAANFVVIEGLLLLSGKRPWRAMPLAAAATLIAYAASIVIFCPAYLKQAVPMALSLYAATDTPFLALLNDLRYVIAGEVLAIALLAFRWRSMPYRSLMLVLVSFAITSTVVCLADGKNWYYHRLPAIISTSLALALWAAVELRQARAAFKPAIAMVALSLFMFMQTAVHLMEPEVQEAITPRDSAVVRLERLIRKEHARSYVAFSEWLALGFPVVNNTGVVWASRFDSMWALKGEVWRMGFDHAVAKEWPITRWITHDFIAGCPDIAVVDTRESTNYIRVLSAADPTFARVWTRYKPIAAFDGLVVFKRDRGGCLNVWVAAGANQAKVVR